MTGKYVAMLAWIALTMAIAGPALAENAGAENAGRGEALYDLCKQCHGADGGGMELALAPAIAGLDEWYVEAQLKAFKSGARGLHHLDVAGRRMYPMSLWLTTDEDIAAVAGYVAGMPGSYPETTLEGGDPAKGAASYTICASCHGAAGEGNKVMNAPPLASMSDWYLQTSLQKYKAGIRGGNPKNPNAMLMRGMSMTLVDEQAIKDVIAHIMTLRKTQ